MSVKYFSARFWLSLAFITLFAVGVEARPSSDWTRSEFADVRLVTGSSAVGGGSVPAGLQFRMADGWKVYWRSAGDAGFPPELDWSKSTNLKSATISWPVPKRFSLFGLETFGYSGDTVYPLQFEAEDPSQDIRVHGFMTALICEEICVPVEAEMAMDIPAGEAGPTPFTRQINMFRARVPGARTGGDLRIQSVSAVGSPKAHSLEVRLQAESGLEAPDVIPEGPTGFSFGKPETRMENDGQLAVLTVPVGVPEGGDIVGSAFTLTAVDGVRFLERRVDVTGTAPSGVGSGIWVILMIAWAGGLILNLMPCVLPVLSLKLMGAISYGGAEPGRIRRGFLASAAGILFSFLVLAAAAIGLRSAGLAVGWGIQFQQPVFLVLMTALLFAFAANMAGFFEIPLPRFIADRFDGSGGAEGGSLARHFGTGAFATLLATPCSAPFVGTAVAFALSGTPTDTLMIFAVMGIGLATPYLVVAAVPALAAALPKPGNWMIRVRQVLAIALAGTGIWLLTVLAAQVGFPGSSTGTASNTENVTWVAFDEGEIDRLTAEGRIVLVDVTADWCLTCKVNKKLVLDQGEVNALLASGDVVAMRADWTNPDETISAYLASFGRYGIPFNAVYGPSARSGIALPELLDTGAVLSAVKKAGS